MSNKSLEKTMASVETIENQWKEICKVIRKEVGENAFRSWIAPLTITESDSDILKLATPTRFIRDWIKTHYLDRIRDLWLKQNPEISGVELTVVPKGKKHSDTQASKDTTVPDEANSQASEIISYMGEKNGVLSDLDARFTFENFVVGKSNELAHAAARRVAENPTVTFNPLFLYSGAGLGKTHLMHAIAWQIRRQTPNRKVIYMSAEKFMYQFIRALRYKDMMSFKEQFRSVDVLMIDDVQFIGGKETISEEFFHTFNALVDQNRQVVVSADKSPSDLERVEERMRSRLGWGLVADIHPTTYELRLGILQSKAEGLKANVPIKVMEFLAHKITSNVRELEGALNRIVAHASLIGRDITLDTTQELLHDILRSHEKHLTVEEIQKKVAEHYSIRVADMYSPRKVRTVARPRQIAIYLSKTLTTKSLPEIGQKFGGRDHSTVIYTVKRIEEMCKKDAAFAEEIGLLKRMVEG